MLYSYYLIVCLGKMVHVKVNSHSPFAYSSTISDYFDFLHRPILGKEVSDLILIDLLVYQV